MSIDLDFSEQLLMNTNSVIGKGMYFTATSYTSSYSYSYDGINYNLGSFGSSMYLGYFCAGKDKVLAFPYDSSDATLSKTGRWSSDGVNWSSYTIPAVRGVYYKPIYNIKSNLYLATGFIQNTNTYMTSTNGINWTLRYLPSSGMWSSICWNGNFYVLNNATTCYVGSDGINWSSFHVPWTARGTLLPLDKLWAIDFGSSPYKLYYYNGSDWTYYNTTSFYISDIYYKKGYPYIMTSGGVVYYSYDLVNWTNVGLPTITDYTKRYLICSGNTRFVAVAYDSTTNAYYSSNGINWTHTNVCTTWNSNIGVW